MITRIAIPKLTLTMEGGTLIQWLKREGEGVQKDEALFEIETDKTTAEVPSPASGELKKILIPSGAVMVGVIVGFIGEKEDVVPDGTFSAAAERENVEAEQATASTESVTESNLIRATPAARRRAREAGVDLAGVRGSGPEGRITQEDVEAAIANLPPAAPAVQSAGTDYRKTIAERTLHAWQGVPHVHVGGELNAGGLKAAIEKVRAEGATNVTVTDVLLFLTASVLRGFGVLNAVWAKHQAQPHSEINLGFAVHSNGGVVIPVIHSADHRSLREITSERLRLKNAVLNHSLHPRDMEGGTFTLTNLGMYPVDFFAPIINYPQCAILATGRVRKGGSFEGTADDTGWKMWANVALDHRVADGAVAAKFLAELEKAMEGLRFQVL